VKPRATKILFVSLASIVAAGCASLQTPSADLLIRVPVVEIGHAKPQNDQYILFVPAGREVPVKLTIAGSFLAESASAETKVKLRQDLYLYKYWLSFDGKRWERSQRVFGAAVSAGLEPAGGKVEIEFNKIQ
jgi:hypothetical protein